jgi:Ca2+-binding RTX toxin-like protein
MAGPLFIEGYVDAAADRSIKTAIMLPGETDVPLVPLVIANVDENTLIDTLTIHNDSSVSNDVGVMGAGSWFDANAVPSTNISGLGLANSLTFGTDFFPSGAKTFSGGVTYRNVEVAEVLLGQGDDNFTINDTLRTTAVHGGLTVVHGGGNTSETAGDTITVTNSSSALVVYGDTSQDGARYNGQSGVASGLGIRFDHSGNDVIDANASSKTVTIYGGAGDDNIRGSQAGDHLFGGSGNDTISGEAGDDHIYGDSGINVALNTRFIDVVTVNRSALANHDGLAAGGDTIHGNAGNDIVFGDHGRIDQTAGTLRILTTGNVTKISTVVPGNGVGDTITGDQGVDRILGGNGGDTISGGTEGDIILGDHGVIDYYADGNTATVDFVYTNNPDDGGGNDTISGNAGEDLILGGSGADLISGDSENDVIFGDHGIVRYAGGSMVSLQSEQGSVGGADVISGNAGNDLILGGAAGDSITGDAGNDTILGDHGVIELSAGIRVNVRSEQSGIGGADTISGNDGDDLIVGGALSDTITGDVGNDVVLGDEGRIEFNAGAMIRVRSEQDTVGGADTIRGNEGEDVLVGGAFGDRIDGGSERDLVFGDNVLLDRTIGDQMANARYRTLTGAEGGQIYSTTPGIAGTVLVTATSRAIPGGTTPVWEDFDINLLDHDKATEAAGLSNFGNDYIAGGAQSDQIFGQLGDDVIQGDGSIDSAVGASRLADGTLSLQASVENLATDGDDYIEGNGGHDVIFGNLGQDDIIGGSSSLFSLTTPDRRTDANGTDMLFGGAGTDVAITDGGRLDAGDTLTSRHANDSDMLLGDNGNIYRLVNGTTGAGLTFGYDQTSAAEDRGTKRIVVRAAQLLDYTPGGADVNAAAANDIGAADEIHGESGDDFIYGTKGADVIFGEGQDDDIVGGYGNDWISGGTGQDGVLGDDGRIFTSRNGTADPLGGVLTATVQSSISTPGGVQYADLNVTGQLKKSVDITPYSQDLGFDGSVDEFGGQSKHTSDDIIYGGLGSDFLHGGTGDDAMSGAEALWQFYSRPTNPGNVLAYSTTTTEFDKYDEYLPRTKIVGFLLNFNQLEGVNVASATYGTVQSDGDDKIFGDTGNDWIVGGTGRDDLYGGFGDDLLNADDNQDTTGGTNDAPDTHPSYEDRAFGGAGRDVLIANTGGDRLIDWAGEFNSYIVPFAPFGMGTVSRTLQPQLAEFLYALSASDGADATRARDTGSAAARNGEPQGELGLIRQQDFAWQDQTGGPRDPQPGNIGGGKRDVLRSASFDDPAVPLSGFAADSGVWAVSGGALQVAATSPLGDAVSVFQVDDALPVYFEMQASVTVQKPVAGWKANSFLIFDYINQTDFKYAGIDVSTNKLVIGHHTAAGWIVDVQTPLNAKADTTYNVVLAVNGLTATVLVDNKTTITKTFAARVVEGYSYGLNWGLTGVGSDSSRGSFDNVKVQVIAPEATTVKLDEFTTGTGAMFTAQAKTGSWTASGGRYAGAPATGSDAAVQAMTLGVSSLQALSLLQLNATLNTTAQAGFVFDRYSDQDYKFVLIDAQADKILIGHRTAKGGVVIDTSVAKVIDAGVDYTLGVTLKGSTVSATLNGQTMVSYAFNALTVDGGFGLLSRGGSSSFDAVTAKTNDAMVAKLVSPLVAAIAPAGAMKGETLQAAELAAFKDEAVRRWAAANGSDFVQGMAAVSVSVTDLPGLQLGAFEDGQILIDVDAAGYGWFIDRTPGDDSEFTASGGILVAAQGNAAGRMDLLSVIEHELGHAAGLVHEEGGVMAEALASGTRTAAPAAPAPVSAPVSARVAVPSKAPAETWTLEQPATTTVAAAPTIDWKAPVIASPAAVASAKAANWQEDFVNHLARSEAQRNPNAGLKVQVNVTPKLAATLGALEPTV